MSKPWTVVVTDPMHRDASHRLAGMGRMVVLSEPGVARAQAMAEADALIVRTPISEDDVRAGTRLKLIVRHGAGLDFIPVALAQSHGIAVANVPDANSVSVAEYVIGAMLAAARGFALLDRELRAGHWAIRAGFTGQQLAGKTLGIVGVGRIGRLVAERAHHGLGLVVLGFDPAAAGFPPHVGRVAALDALLSRSDIVTLHVPLLPSTANLIDATRLRRMKRGSLLINAARGGLVDEAELARALHDGHLAGAAVDVYSRQPIAADHPLLGVPNVLLTPHAASLTLDSYRAMGMGSVDEVERAINGQPLLNPVPPSRTPPTA